MDAGAAALAARLALFAAPIILAALPAEVVFHRAGESWSAARVAEMQLSDPSLLYGRRHMSQDYQIFKALVVEARKPDVIVTGDSRSMEYRDFMFHPIEKRFYNAGGMAQNNADLAAYAKLLEDAGTPAPKTLILNVSPWWNVAAPSPLSSLSTARDAALTLPAHVFAIRGLYAEWWRDGKVPTRFFAPGFTRDAPGSYTAAGLSALDGHGFRADGSRMYYTYVEEYRKERKYRDRETPPAIERFRRRDRQFDAASWSGWDRPEGVIEPLKRIRALGIEVIVVLPPFSNELEREIARSADLGPLYREYREVLPRELARIGVPCVSARSPASAGLTDGYMLDGFHPGEVFVSHIVERITASAAPGSVLKRVDAGYIEKRRSEKETLPVAFGE